MITYIVFPAYGVTTDDQTTFINASNCTLRYKPKQPPIVFDFPIPEGHSKAELDTFPRNNLSSTSVESDVNDKS